MRWPLLLIIFQISNTFACTVVQVAYKKLKYDLCYDASTRSYLSKECKSIDECFKDNKPITQIYPNQSPGFTQCYSAKGEPFFAVVSNSEKKVPLCNIDKVFVDLESLANAAK